MRQCPVCDQKTDSPRCPTCGFDVSRDYEHAPTFAPTMSVAARRKAWQERQQARKQELQWQTEREQTQASLKAAESQCRQLEQENRELNSRLADAESRAASASENADLKAEYEKKLEEARREAKTAQIKLRRSVPPHIYRDEGIIERLYSRLVWLLFFPVEEYLLNKLGSKSDSNEWSLSTPAPDVDPKSFHRLRRLSDMIKFCHLLVRHAPFVLLEVYIILTLGHFALFHAPWSATPCETHPSCSIFLCAPEDHHHWNDPGCLEPRTCTVCGEKSGGTDGHVWGPSRCILCGATHDEATFAYVTTADSSISSSFLEDDKMVNLLRFNDITMFPTNGIYVKDHKGSSVTVTTEITGSTLEIRFPKSLPEGSYTVRERGSHQLLATLHYCRPGIPFPCDAWEQSVPFRAMNLLTGQQLVHDSSSYYTTVQEHDAQSIETAPGLCVKNHYLTADGEWITLYTFVSGSRYLAANSNGTVYWSKDLTDECYWLIQEETT